MRRRASCLFFFVSGDGHIGKETSEGKQKHLSYAAGSTETAEQCRKLGTARYFGGNTVSGLMKHMKVNNASRCVEDARRDLATFRDELGDIRDIENLHVDIDGFLTFADFSLIGLLLISSFSQRSEKGRGKCRRQSEE